MAQAGYQLLREFVTMLFSPIKHSELYSKSGIKKLRSFSGEKWHAKEALE